jgi:hypothetical protein
LLVNCYCVKEQAAWLLGCWLVAVAQPAITFKTAGWKNRKLLNPKSTGKNLNQSLLDFNGLSYYKSCFVLSVMHDCNHPLYIMHEAKQQLGAIKLAGGKYHPHLSASSWLHNNKQAQTVVVLNSKQSFFPYRVFCYYMVQFLHPGTTIRTGT